MVIYYLGFFTKLPRSSRRFVFQLLYSCFGFIKQKTTPATPLTKMYFVSRGFKRGLDWRREWDLNPRCVFGAHTISSRAPSTPRTSLHTIVFSFARFAGAKQASLRLYKKICVFAIIYRHNFRVK